jgi:DNA polymerase V
MIMGIEISFAEHHSELSLQYVGQQISAGFPSPAEDYLESTLDINKILIKNPSSTFTTG